MTSFWIQVALAVSAVGPLVPTPGNASPLAVANTCTTPKIRRAWHTLTNEQKKAYLDAEVCLMQKPSTLGLRGSRTKFDDFQSAHALQTEVAHFVGQFLHFHRLFLHAHEKALAEECGYKGAQPYWEESNDVGAFSRSILLDPVYGFGGNGVGGKQCIQDGPFANYTNPIGPGYLVNDHCIERQISDAFSQAAAPATIGAQMLNPVSSPGDPIFFLHHAWLDRMWAKWTEKDPEARMTQIGGINRADMNNIGIGPPPGASGGRPGGGGGASGGFVPANLTRPHDVPEPKIIGDPANVTTMNHLIQLHGIVPDRTVAELMDTRADYLCYEYD